MHPALTILAPTSFEATQLRRGLSAAGATLQVVQVGVGPGARFGGTWASALLPGSVVILAGVAGALSRACMKGTARWASAVIDAEGRRWIPTVRGSGNGADASSPAGEAVLAGTDGVVASVEDKRSLHERTGACMVDCESASFAREASSRGWRWGVVRGISDGADDAVPSWMPQLLRPDGSVDAGAIAGTLIANPLRATCMMRSARDAGHAMRAACALLAAFAQEPHETRGARRVLLFGGTFDPPHQRHVSMASAAATLLECDRIVVMPAGRSPLRRGAETAPPALRLAMTRAAFVAEPRAVVSDLEMRRGGTSYTVDTLLALGAGSVRTRADTVLLIGSDQALQFGQWRDATRILDELAAVAVVLRPPDDRETFARRCGERGGEAAEWVQRLLPLPPVDLSATAIRSALVRGDDPHAIAGLAPAVAALIAAHGTYRTPAMPA
jgi:nicotinate-nucleotide adenylyltransferase